MNVISVSFCSYNDKKIPWDLIIKYSGERYNEEFFGEITLNRDKNPSEEEWDILNTIMPACVWTDYVCKQGW